MNVKRFITIAIFNITFLYLYAGDTIRESSSLLYFDYLDPIVEIDCSLEDNGFETNGTTEVKEILGKQCRILIPSGESSYFYYRIGKDANLQAGKAYFLEIEYPDDVDRNFVVQNRGGEYTRGIQTGKTLGDGYDPPYVLSNPESISLPHTQKFIKWRTLFWLHDHYAGLELPRNNGTRAENPDDGFLVIICQYDMQNSPFNNGAAISAIRLYEAPAEELLKMDINYPPDDLPRRHLFFREEMSDGVVNNSPPAVSNPIDWYEHKAQLMRFLGMNTFSKDLLEFGHNQGWDPGEYGYNWVNTPAFKDRWENIISMLGKYDLDVLPYYEYAGSIGPEGLGPQQRAHPLNDSLPDYDYTHISWTEDVNADITDPDTYADLKKIFDQTIIKFKDQVHFIGAWIRPRSSENPISFADAALERFRVEANESIAVTRAEISADSELYDRYLSWWFNKRKAFLTEMTDYLRSSGVNDSAIVLYTTDPSESGKTHYDWGYNSNILSDNRSAFRNLPYTYPVFDLDAYIAKDWQLYAQLLPENTWGDWEWQHAAPVPDPYNYKNEDRVLLTYTFNKAYTVGSSSAFEPFRTKSGLAIIRHYCLNEDGMSGMGYFVSDIEWHGPYTVLAEARAVANGDPRYIGYLASSAFNRGSIAWVRNFNRNFLALPAIPSNILPAASTDTEVIVREYPAGSHGTYLAIVNTGLNDKTGVKVSLPFTADVMDAATGENILSNVSEVILDLYPAQLKSLLLKTPSGKQSQQISVVPIPKISIDDESIEIEASASSGLPVNLILESGLVSINGNTLTLHTAGLVSLNITQQGNEDYFPASRSIMFMVYPEKTDQIIHVDTVGQKFSNDPPFRLNATASSGLAVATEIIEGPATMENDTIYLTGDAGEVKVSCFQEGDYRYLPADTLISFSVIAPVSSELRNDEQLIIRVYPNPFREEIYIEPCSPSTLNLYHISGRSMLQTEVNSKRMINLAGYSPGFYIAEFRHGSGKKNIKLMKLE